MQRAATQALAEGTRNRQEGQKKEPLYSRPRPAGGAAAAGRASEPGFAAHAPAVWRPAQCATTRPAIVPSPRAVVTLPPAWWAGPPLAERTRNRQEGQRTEPSYSRPRPAGGAAAAGRVSEPGFAAHAPAVRPLAQRATTRSAIVPSPRAVVTLPPAWWAGSPLAERTRSRQEGQRTEPSYARAGSQGRGTAETNFAAHAPAVRRLAQRATTRSAIVPSPRAVATLASAREWGGSDAVASIRPKAGDAAIQRSGNLAKYDGPGRPAETLAAMTVALRSASLVQSRPTMTPRAMWGRAIAVRVPSSFRPSRASPLPPGGRRPSWACFVRESEQISVAHRFLYRRADPRAHLLTWLD